MARYIQMEDEWRVWALSLRIAGRRKKHDGHKWSSFTLIQENLGYAAMAEIPCVTVAVQRGGPSTGLPTLPAQGDIMQSRWGTHGDHPIIVFSPASVRESFDCTVDAFNCSEKYRTPAIVLSDAVIAHLRERTVLPDQEDIVVVNRKAPRVPPEEYLPYMPEEDGIPPMANLGMVICILFLV